MKGQMNQGNRSIGRRFIRLLLVAAYALGMALVLLLMLGAASAQPLDEAPRFADELTFTLLDDPLTPVTGPSPQRQARKPLLGAGDDEVTLLGFTFVYSGTTVEDGKYIWTYGVSSTGVQTHALNYWELTGLCEDVVRALVEPVSIPDDGEDEITGTYALVRSTGKTISYTVEAKPNGNDSYIKFEGAVNEEGEDDGLGEDGVETDTFELIFNRNFAREMVGVSAKVGPGADSGEIRGPAGAELSVAKSDSPDPVIAGHSLTYTLVITNSGPSDASSVTVTDTLPSEVTHVSHTSSLGSFDSGTGQWDVSDLAANASAMLTIVVTVDPSTTGTITNTATVTATTTDPTLGNNTDSEETTVNAEADLAAITKSDDPEPVGTARTLTYTLVYSNSGPSDAQEVYITRTLPTAVTYGGVVSEVPSIAGPTVTLPYLTWYTPTLAAGASGTIVLTATVDAGAVGTASSVRISSSTLDPNPGSNFDDGDGVGGEVEDGAPNNGDGNNDGIPDRLQENVTSLPNAVDQRYVTLASPGGTNFGSVQTSDNPSPGDAPPEVGFAVGCFECIVQGIPPGDSVTVTLHLPPGVAANTFDYYKFGATPDNPELHWYEFLFDETTGTGAEILHGEDRVILYLVDGARGDDDLLANGEIIDWGCPGQPSGGPPPPRPVGGVTLPVSAFELLGPRIGLAALMGLAVLALVVELRRGRTNA